jgi:shikimate kinase
MGGHIFLVGMMGAGKTTVGKSLATRLRRPFVDTDKRLVERTGVPVATIFEVEGEAGFRRRESSVLAELADESECVVATGGGIVLDPANRAAMREQGTVIYLRARVEHLWERTRHDTHRPLLATPDPKATLARLLAEREPLYQEVAHVIVETGHQGTATILNRVHAALQRHLSGATP